MIPACYFLTPKEVSKCAVICDVQTKGNHEPGLHVYLSELSDHRLILFVHLHDRGTLNFTIDYNGYTEPQYLSSGQLLWRVINKSGYLKVKSADQSYEFDIDPAKEYTDTVFKFADNQIKCLKECD
jgi:hypothetical protein